VDAKGWKRIGRVEDFRPGCSRSIQVGGRRVAIFRAGDEWLALEDVCPHMRARLSEGRVEAGTVTCGWHGWQFDLRSGACLNKTWARVRVYPLRLDGGEVWLGPPP
jgi:nitrite reductase/ring-hydroxylating ferredoxin subunit